MCHFQLNGFSESKEEISFQSILSLLFLMLKCIGIHFHLYLEYKVVTHLLSNIAILRNFTIWKRWYWFVKFKFCWSVKLKDCQRKLREFIFLFCITAIPIYYSTQTLQDIYFAKFIAANEAAHVDFMRVSPLKMSLEWREEIFQDSSKYQVNKQNFKWYANLKFVNIVRILTSLLWSYCILQ